MGPSSSGTPKVTDVWYTQWERLSGSPRLLGETLGLSLEPRQLAQEKLSVFPGLLQTHRTLPFTLFLGSSEDSFLPIQVRDALFYPELLSREGTYSVYAIF